MAYKYILYEKEGNVARLTLNKPDKMNALGFVGWDEDFKEVCAALKEAADDDDVKCVILSGKGKAFCAGQDVSRVGFVYGFGTGKTPGERRPSQRIRLKYDKMGQVDGLMRSIFLHPKITIAQVHGYCIHGGAQMMSLCDIAIAAEDAQIGFVGGARLGFSGTSQVFSVLVATVGLKRALGLLLNENLITGKEAERIGLVTTAVPLSELEDTVNKWAKEICQLPRDGIAIGKAFRETTYNAMGITPQLSTAYIMHTLFTNLRWESDEFNFFRERRQKGVTAAIHAKDKS